MSLLDVRVISPGGELNSFKARSVSSVNSAGKFDVLPGHANFVTYISDHKVIIVTENKEKVELEYKVAIIEVTKDKVTIFVDVEALRGI